MPESPDDLRDQLSQARSDRNVAEAARNAAERKLALVRDTLAREVDETYATARGEYRAGLERAMVLIDRQLA